MFKVTNLRKIIFYLFAFLLFSVPLVLWPYTSEVFEFNKIVLTYALTGLIIVAWIIRMILERKLIFRRTMLDIPLLIFLGSQAISTLLSIDPYTSVLGYYSRFNGGLLSLICYSLLYWAFVSNLNVKLTVNLIKVMFVSGVLVSVYAVLEHFGIDKNIWVQDVQSRVFSTLGQPNWLAAYVTAMIFVAWAFAMQTSIKSKNFLIYFGISILFFWTLIFTKSRSGLLGFAFGALVYWGLTIWQNRKNISGIFIPLSAIGLFILTICLISGTQWTPSVVSYLTKVNSPATKSEPGTSLETGGTESGTIRKIVWKGAFDIWRHYPVFGTGVETFAFAYYQFRPLEHNITSEWDFIYNKAHNEFLNFAANTGIIGLISYLVIICVSVYLILKSKTENDNLKYGLVAGLISLSASNFFGFSVVPTQLEFYLFPALAFALGISEEEKVKKEKLAINTSQKVIMTLLLLFTFYFLLWVFRYWRADILYANAKAQNSASRPDLALSSLTKAIRLQSGQAIYLAELSSSYSAIAMAYDQSKDATSAGEFTALAVGAIQKAVEIAPANINIRRQMFGIYVRLSTIEEKYLAAARNSLVETIKMAPTDAKLYYNLGIADANLGDNQNALVSLQKAIELKPNYAEARIEYAALLVHLKQNTEAKKQLEYVLTNIDPNNEVAKTALGNL